MLDIYLLPKRVSFYNLRFKEGETTADITGWFVGRVNPLHAEWPSWPYVGEGNINTGCKVLIGWDKLEGGPIWDVDPYSDGTFHWNIPCLYKVGTTEDQFDYASSEFTVNPDGDATVEKDNVGPYGNNHNDPSQNY